MLDGIKNFASGFIPGMGGGMDEHERKKMKALDELRDSVSSAVWSNMADYARSKLEATTPGSIDGVIEELKKYAADKQEEFDETQKSAKAYQDLMKDTLNLSAAAQVQVVATPAPAAQ
jgi:hypothetical protein